MASGACTCVSAHGPACDFCLGYNPAKPEHQEARKAERAAIVAKLNGLADKIMAVAGPKCTPDKASIRAAAIRWAADLLERGDE